jgi:hypothetical protein
MYIEGILYKTTLFPLAIKSFAEVLIQRINYFIALEFRSILKREYAAILERLVFSFPNHRFYIA